MRVTLDLKEQHNIMNKKLYFYSTILAIAYILFFGNCVYEIVDSMVGGAKFGMKEFGNGNISKAFNHEILGSYLTPKQGTGSFPSSILNEKTGENLRLEIREAMVFVTQLPDSIPFYVSALKVLIYIFNAILLFLFAYLPFIAYRIIKSIPKDKFYSPKNINAIRKVSFIILGMFVITILSLFFMNIISEFYLQLEGYEIAFREFNFPFLFLGLTILILSEILRYTTTIKEEQEFTI
jgi:hypothetical protein